MMTSLIIQKNSSQQLLESSITLAYFPKNDSTSSRFTSYGKGDAAIVLMSNCSIASSGFKSAAILPTFFPEIEKQLNCLVSIEQITLTLMGFGAQFNSPIRYATRKNLKLNPVPPTMRTS